MLETLTGDGALAIFSAVGLVVTAVSIVRDTRAQKQRLAAEELPLDRAAERPSNSARTKATASDKRATQKSCARGSIKTKSPMAAAVTAPVRRANAIVFARNEIRRTRVSSWRRSVAVRLGYRVARGRW